jgi:hypothetical protein
VARVLDPSISNSIPHIKVPYFRALGCNIAHNLMTGNEWELGDTPVIKLWSSS